MISPRAHRLVSVGSMEQSSSHRKEVAKMAKRKATIEKIQESARAAGGELYGHMVCWSLIEADAEVADLQVLFDSVGLDKRYFPPDIRGSAAFRKALAQCQREHSAFRVRPVNESDEEILVRVIQEQRTAQQDDLNFIKECRLRFDKTHLSVTSDIAGHPFGEAVKRAYHELTGHYVRQDFVRMMTRNVRHLMMGVGIRKTGGFYFVPRTHTDDLLKHKQVLAGLGDSEMVCIEVYEGSSKQPDLARTCKKALSEELQELQDELKEFKGKPPRRDTLRRRLDAFKELKNKTEFYASMMEIRVADLQQGVRETAAELRKLLQVEEERVEAKEVEKNSQKNPQRVEAGKQAAQTQATKRLRTIAEANGRVVARRTQSKVRR